MADALLLRGEQVAAGEGITLRALLEEGLRLALERRGLRRTFTLRDASVSGSGLQEGRSWRAT